MDRCLATEFKLLTFMTQTQHHVEKLNKNPEQYKLNRYPEYMTFEPSRVLLGDPNDKDNIENYINANFIDFLGKRAIATQAPISKCTFYNFWRMVDQYNVSKIFMLCNIIEKSKPKCDRYFPQNANPEPKFH
jgi:protein tyrosine phosphatase